MKCEWFDVCPLWPFEATGRVTQQWALRYCGRDRQAGRRYQLEEQGVAHAVWVLPDGSPDERLR